jgi:RNA polymerase sigma-70 factor (ECF subfamily)
VSIHPLRIDICQAVPAALPVPAPSDEALIARIATGDKLAMRALFARHHLRIYRFALRLVREREAAEDIISEVFLEVWRHAATFGERAKVSTWLLAIARFKGLSRLRRRGEAPLDEHTAAALVDPDNDPELAIRKQERSDILRRCLARLSPAHREIVDLVYYQDLAISQVAEVVGIPENTVKTRMFHARKQLSGLLAAAGIERSLP